MAESLFMFLAEGIAQDHPRCRVGAKHALMIFATGGTLDDARDLAIRFALDGGWGFVRVKRVTQIYDTAAIEDETLRETAEEARETGCALVVYTDEIPNAG